MLNELKKKMLAVVFHIMLFVFVVYKYMNSDLVDDLEGFLMKNLLI